MYVFPASASVFSAQHLPRSTSHRGKTNIMGYVDKILMAGGTVICQTRPYWILYGWAVVSLPIAVVGPAAMATRAAAQTLQGIVIDRSTGTRVGYAFIRFRAIDGPEVEAVVCDSAGEFRIRLTPGARYQAEVRAAGYLVQSDTVQTFRGPTASVLLRLRPAPFPLEPLRVVVPKENSSLAATGFYHRREMGFGYFMTANEIEQTVPVVMTDALRNLARVQVMCEKPGNCDLGTGGCLPTVVLDGVVVRRGGPPERTRSKRRRPRDPSTPEPPTPEPPTAAPPAVGVSRRLTLDDLLNPFNIEAIEIYPSAAGVPPQYMSPCGAVIAWSKK